MAVQQVYIPEKKDKFGNVMGTVGQGANIYDAGKTFGWWGGGGGGGATTGGAVGANAGNAGYTGSTYAAPQVSTPAAAEGAGAASGESAAGMAGPIGIAVAGTLRMGQGMDDKLRGRDTNAANEYQQWVDVETGKKGLFGTNPTSGIDKISKATKGWNGDSISRRLSAKNMEPMNPFNFSELRKTIEVMPLADVDKSNMLGKISQLANLSNLFKNNKA